MKRWTWATIIVALAAVSPGMAQSNKVPSVPKAILDANASVKLGIPQGARIFLREVAVFVDGYPDLSLRAFVEPLLKAALTDVGFTIVASPQEVRREAEERRFERESEEVHKGSLPPKGSILRETVELKVTVHLVRSSRQLTALLGELRRQRIDIGGFYLRKNETGAIAFLEVIDNATLTTMAQLVSFATDRDETPPPPPPPDYHGDAFRCHRAGAGQSAATGYERLAGGGRASGQLAETQTDGAGTYQR